MKENKNNSSVWPLRCFAATLRAFSITIDKFRSAFGHCDITDVSKKKKKRKKLHLKSIIDIQWGVPHCIKQYITSKGQTITEWNISTFQTHLQIHSGKTEPFSFRQITNKVGPYLKGGGELPQCLTHFAKDAGSI